MVPYSQVVGGLQAAFPATKGGMHNEERVTRPSCLCVQGIKVATTPPDPGNMFPTLI